MEALILRLRLPAWGQMAANAALVVLWLWLYRAVFPYFGVIFTREEFRTNQLVLVGAAALVFVQARKGSFPVHLQAAPLLQPAALALLLGSSLLYLGVERFLDINTLSASLFGLAGYGLLGLWMPERPWRQGLPAALLLVGALPFGNHMETFIGYPVRMATAEIVRAGLSAAGVPLMGADTILVFENGVSKVDLPCSGVKSLWTGGLFFLAATWIERRPINPRWGLAAVGLAAALLAANLVRVAVLVSVGFVAGWQLMAEMLHVPLGVLGFLAACGLGLLLLRYAGNLAASADLPDSADLPAPADMAAASKPSARLAPALAAVLIVMGLLYTPRPVPAAPPLVEYIFPAGVQVQDWALTPAERAWLAEAEVESVQRWHFQSGDLSGSMLMVTSDTWRAHHRPENCFGVYGLAVDQSMSVMAAPDFPVRVLWLSTARQAGLMTAAYWLQSSERVTDDYAERMWADLGGQRSRWVLVTVLFDRPVDPESEAALALYRQVQSAVGAQLDGTRISGAPVLGGNAQPAGFQPLALAEWPEWE